MTTNLPNEYNALSPFVALIQQIVDQTISESGVGASSFAGLSDKTSANLPVLNSPLATVLAALASKATADAHYADTGNPHNTNLAQLGAQAALISGTTLKTVGGVTLLGAGDIPATAGATAFTGLSDKTTADLPGTNTPLAAALAAKVPVLATVSIGAGAIALNAAAHANRPIVWTGSTPQTVTIDTTGGTVDDLYIVINQGTADVTMPGTAGSGYSLVIVPNTGGSVEWRGGATFLSWIPSPGSIPLPINDLTTGGTTSYASAQQLVVLKGLIDGISSTPAPVTVTGSTAVGSVLTRNLAAGWTEASGKWVWIASGVTTDIAGATSSTYTTVSGDAAHQVTWKSATIPYIPTGIVVASVAGALTGTFVTIANENCTTAGYADWIVYPAVTTETYRQNHSALISGPTFSNMGSTRSTGTGIGSGADYLWDGGASWIDEISGVNYSTSHCNNQSSSWGAPTAANSYVRHTFPAGTVSKTAKIVFGSFIGTGPSGPVVVKATLSDGSSAPVTLTPTTLGIGDGPPFAPVSYEASFTYTAATAGQSLYIDVIRSTNDASTPQVGVSRVTYGA